MNAHQRRVERREKERFEKTMQKAMDSLNGEKSEEINAPWEVTKEQWYNREVSS